VVSVAPGPAVVGRVLDRLGFNRMLTVMPVSSESDHVRAATERQVAIYRAMTPRQRLEQGLRMNRSMRELMATGFRYRHPDWSELQVNQAVADRILHARTG
jgi:hypothetical protein